MERDAERGVDWVHLPVIATVARLLCREGRVASTWGWPAPVNDTTRYVSPMAYAAVSSRLWYRGRIASGAGGR
jgi:hypothetical protein